MQSSIISRGRQAARKFIPEPVRQLLWKLFYRIKDSDGISGKIIDTCKWVMWNAEFISHPSLRGWVFETARFTGDFALLMSQVWGLRIYKTRYEGGTYLYSGTPAELGDLNRKLFGGAQLEVTDLGRTPIWKLPSTVRKFLAEDGQLVILDLSSLSPVRFQAPYLIQTATWISQEITLPSKVERLLDGKQFMPIRSRINRAKRMGFDFHFSRDEADFRSFYVDMYAPYIVSRHGDSGYVEPFEQLHWWFKHGGIILTTQDGKPVAGNLVAVANDKGLNIDVGVLNADPDMIKLGIQTINVWSKIQWFAQHRVKRVDLGGSRAYRHDGVFTFKRQWGATVHRLYSFIRSKRTILMNNPPAGLCQQVNALGFISEVQGKFLGVQVEPGPREFDRVEIAEMLEQALHDGLSGVLVATPYRSQIFRADGVSAKTTRQLEE